MNRAKYFRFRLLLLLSGVVLFNCIYPVDFGSVVLTKIAASLSVSLSSFFLNENQVETYHPIVKDLKIILPSSNWTSKVIEIVIYTTSQNLEKVKSRKLRLEKAANQMNNDKCFEGCHIQTSNQDQSKVDSADAVLFFMFMRGFKSKDLPQRKNLSQIWVYMQHEPPFNYSPGKHLNDLFNWTMTYREDSDLYQPYFKAVSITHEEPLRIENKTLGEWIRGKTNIGTAVISNCWAKSKRLEILKNLKSSGLPIDIYGGCGIKKGTCGRYNSNCKDFWRELGSKYKFHFAFENSLCTDYITEKFWNSLKLGMVPVVLGRGNYERFAPPHSFIDIRDFSHPEELVEYLHRLDGDSKEYGEYFEWRKKYSVELSTDNLCNLCSRMKLYKSSLLGGKLMDPLYSKQHPNLTGWWVRDATGEGPACISPKEMGLQKYLVDEYIN